jgi:hypothetical protein
MPAGLVHNAQGVVIEGRSFNKDILSNIGKYKKIFNFNNQFFKL